GDGECRGVHVAVRPGDGGTRRARHARHYAARFRDRRRSAPVAPGARGQRAMSRTARDTPRKRQAGFSLVAAIFIIAVLAVLAALMVTIGSVQRTTVAQALQAARAYQAANAGIEWAIVRAINPVTRVATCGAAPLTPKPNSFAVN